MIGSLGVPELLFILVLALLIFGPRKLHEIGRTLGRALGEFRRATSDLKRTLDAEMSSEESKTPPPPKANDATSPNPEPTPASLPAAEDLSPSASEDKPNTESASDKQEETA